MNMPFRPEVVFAAINDEIRVVVGTLRDKGVKRFGRAIGGAVFFAFAAYVGVYIPPQRKSARLQSEISRAKLLVENCDKFKELREQSDAAAAGLPQLTDREEWLSNSVRDSLLVGGLEPENFTQVKENIVDGLVFQTSSISLTLRFPEFFDWLLRVENARPLMHMNGMDLTKKGGRIGYNLATADVSTVIPLKRYR
ncbi:MAG: hypothetical protein ACHQ49_00675 [Elusimicrobiota bacterium]